MIYNNPARIPRQMGTYNSVIPGSDLMWGRTWGCQPERQMWQPRQESVWQKLLTARRLTLCPSSPTLISNQHSAHAKESTYTYKYRNVCSSFNEKSQELGTTQKGHQSERGPKEWGFFMRWDTKWQQPRTTCGCTQPRRCSVKGHWPGEHTAAVLGTPSFKTGRVSRGNKDKIV